MDLGKVRRTIRGKTMNVLERVEQLDGPTSEEVLHLDAAIKYLAKAWEECKIGFGTAVIH